MEIGDLIKNARKKAGLTQQELADKMGVSYVNVSQWETGRRIPKFETRKKIADLLGVPLSSLFLVSELDPKFGGSEEIEREIFFTLFEQKGIPMKYLLSEYGELFPFLSGKSDKEVQIQNDLLSAFDSMNSTGQQKAVENVRDLAKVPEYQKDQTPSENESTIESDKSPE